MKLKRIKDLIEPRRCTFCHQKKAYHRIHGHGFYGCSSCRECYEKEKKRKEEYNAIWGNREQSEAEFQLGV